MMGLVLVTDSAPVTAPESTFLLMTTYIQIWDSGELYVFRWEMTKIYIAVASEGTVCPRMAHEKDNNGIVGNK